MEARLSFYVYIYIYIYIYINFVADDKREEGEEGGKKASIIQRYGRKRRRTYRGASFEDITRCR